MVVPTLVDGETRLFQSLAILEYLDEKYPEPPLLPPRSDIAAARFGAKRSTPYAVGTVHDFMHAKILVADEYVYMGSFNLSHSGESNAENVIQVESQPIADMCASYIDRVAARYGGTPLQLTP